MIRQPDKTGTKKGRRSTTIQSVSIAARFLDILANAEGPLALREIAKRGQTGTSTAHRYMQTLVKEGFVAQDVANGHYDLGPAALSIGIGALRRIEPVEVAARHMKALSLRLAASCGVAIWTERGPTIIRWYRSAHFVISTVALGDVLPLDKTACGFVFQAYLPSERIKAARKLQPARFRGTMPTNATLDAVREAGGADLSEHLFSLLTGKAAPVFDAQKEIACVMTTVSAIDAANAQGHGKELFAAARAASRECGGG